MKPTPVHVTLSFIFLAGIGLAGFAQREDFIRLVICFAAAAGVYLYAIIRTSEWKWWLAVGILGRILLIPAFPNLSDDVYRFFWDGHMTLMGVSPFAMTPAQALHALPELPETLRAVYPLLNSPEYHSVYPLVNQAVFSTTAALSGGDMGTFVILLKVLFLCCECGSIYLLFLLLKQRGRENGILIYALNPLVILELSGNLHFEALAICFLLMMYYLLKRNRGIMAAVAMSLAVATKILPVILAPFLLRRMPWRWYLAYAVVLFAMSMALFLPVLSTDPSGFLSGLDLYFRRFEFNASMYHLARSAGIAYYGYNAIAVIGPVMAVCALLGLIAVWLGEKRPTLGNFPRIAVIVFSVYLLFATTVHPWYLCPLIAFCAMTKLRYPIAWSLLAFLTYAAYVAAPTREILWVTGVEYIVVFGFMVWDYRRAKAHEINKKGGLSTRYHLH